MNYLKNSDAVLYLLVAPHNTLLLGPPEEIVELSKVTGGRALFYGKQNPKLLARSADLVALEIRHQYLIGFLPKSGVNDNQWHSLKVVVTPSRVSEGSSRFYTRHRVAYRTGGETLKAKP